MGTRADFYVGRGPQAEWLGSIGYDGYPSGIDKEVLHASSEEEYRDNVAAMFESCDHATVPGDGWPWPWNDSRTTDYAYAFDGHKVHACCFGIRWFDPLEDEPELSDDDEKTAIFPDMKSIQKITFGKRSGLMMISIPKFSETQK